MKWICQLGDGKMLAQSEETGLYSVITTGYPYPDTAESNISALQRLYDADPENTLGVLIDKNPKEYMDRILRFFESNGVQSASAREIAAGHVSSIQPLARTSTGFWLLDVSFNNKELSKCCAFTFGEYIEGEHNCIMIIHEEHKDFKKLGVREGFSGVVSNEFYKFCVDKDKAVWGLSYRLIISNVLNEAIVDFRLMCLLDSVVVSGNGSIERNIRSLLSNQFRDVADELYSSTRITKDVNSLNTVGNFKKMISIACHAYLTTKYAEGKGFTYNEKKHLLIFKDKVLGHLTGNERNMKSVEKDSMFNSYMHKHSFVRSSGTGLIYDVSKLCGCDLLYNTAASAFKTFPGEWDYDINTSICKNGEKALRGYYKNYDMAIAKCLLILGDAGDRWKRELIASYGVPHCDCSDLVAFLFVNRYRMDKNNERSGWDVCEVVTGALGFTVVLHPFSYFEDVALEGCDIEKLINDELLSFVKIGLYVFLNKAKRDSRLNRYDLSEDLWGMKYKVNGSKTEVYVTYGQD